MKTRLLSVLAAAAVIALVAIMPAGAANSNEKKGTVVADCVNAAIFAATGEEVKEGEFTYEGVVVAWPPNHKPRAGTVTLTDTDGDPLDGVTVAVAGTHDQYDEGGDELVGSGNTLTDFAGGAQAGGDGSATTGFTFLGERSGTEQDGRTYTFTATGTTDDGTTTCRPEQFTASVPHDMGN